MDGKDLLDACKIGQVDAYEPIQPAGPYDGRIEDVFSVGGSDYLHVAQRVEPVDLSKELHEGPLHFTLTRGADIHPPGCQGIYLIDEDDRWSLLPGKAEDVLDQFCSLSDELLHQFASHDLDEGRFGGGCRCLGEDGLSGSGRTMEKDAFWRGYAYLLEEFGLVQGQFYDLLDLPDLVLETPYVVPGSIRRLDDDKLVYIVFSGDVYLLDDRKVFLFTKNHISGSYLRTSHHIDVEHVAVGHFDDRLVPHEIMDLADHQGWLSDPVQIFLELLDRLPEDAVFVLHLHTVCSIGVHNIIHLVCVHTSIKTGEYLKGLLFTGKGVMENKLHLWLLIIILVFGLGIRLYHINEPYLDHHSWRQTDTASVARNMYHDGFNIFNPAFDTNGNDGKVELELQITPFLTGIVYYFFGIHDWSGRLVPLIFFLLASFFLFRLVNYHYNEKLGLIVTAVYVLLPLNIFFTRVLMPESGMLFFTIAAVYYFSRYLREKTDNLFVFMTVFMTLAVLSKLPTLLLFVPMGILVFQTEKEAWKDWRWYAFVGIVIIMAGGYYGYMHQTSTIRGIIPYKWDTDKWGGVSVWKDAQFYETMFSRFKGVVFNPLGAVLFVFGLIIGWREKLFSWWLVALIAYVFLIARGNSVHSYYQMPFMPVGAFFIGYGIYQVSRFRWTKYLPYVMVCVLAYFSFFQALPLYGLYAQDALDTSKGIKSITTKDELVLTVLHRRDMMPETLYYAERKGWVTYQDQFSAAQLEHYKQKGVSAVAVLHPEYLSRNMQQTIREYPQTRGAAYTVFRI